MVDRPVLVLGGSGYLGRHIVAGLARRGAAVRVLSRRPEEAAALLRDAAQVVRGDLLDPVAVATAVRGVRAVVVAVSAMAPATFRSAGEIERDAVIACLEEARRVGVRRAVVLSIYEIDLETAGRFGIGSARIKLDLEEWLRGSGLEWTVLGQPPSSEIFLRMIRARRFMVVPGGGPPALPTIAPGDSGAVAAEAALRSDLGGKRLRLAGPDVLSFREAAGRIGRAIGRPIRFVPIPLFLPVAIRWSIAPLSRLDDRVGFLHTMLGYLRLLNAFPERIAAMAPADHELLRSTFTFEPTSIEDLARRWRDARGA
jgi:uncharacterized protein YbjT (DUF2867 family)